MSANAAQGMNVAPSVIETIVTLAARDVEGVAFIGPQATSGLISKLSTKPLTQGIEVQTDENGLVNISIRIDVKSAYVLPDVAAKVREAVADAMAMQVGMEVGSVDIFIDGIQFRN